MSALLHLARRVLLSPAVLIVVLGAAAAVGLAFVFGGSSERLVTARFSDVSGLVTGNEVRVGGIEAGTVKSVDVDTSGGTQAAVVVIDVDAAHWPLHQGTKLAVRPKGVLANVFVDLQPGGVDGPVIPADHVFSTSETSSPIALDELSNIFDASVRESLRTQIQDGVLAFGSGGAQSLNDLLHNANPLTADLDPLTATLARRSPELDRLTVEFDTLTHELSSEDAALRGMITGGDTTLGAIASRQHELQGVLDHAAGTLASLDAGLRGEEGNLASFFQKGPVALDKQKQFGDVLSPLITNVDPHIPDLQVLLHEFVTATGFDANGVKNLRADATTNPPNKSAVPCGGAPVDQSNSPSCPDRSTGTAAGDGSGSGSALSTAATSGGDAQPSVIPSLFGSLFG